MVVGAFCPGCLPSSRVGDAPLGAGDGLWEVRGWIHLRRAKSDVSDGAGRRGRGWIHLREGRYVGRGMAWHGAGVINSWHLYGPYKLICVDLPLPVCDTRRRECAGAAFKAAPTPFFDILTSVAALGRAPVTFPGVPIRVNSRLNLPEPAARISYIQLNQAVKNGKLQLKPC
jgi:hypothetical protein